MRFSKMHGTGNDFVVLDGFTYPVDEASVANFARRVCDRHFGVGADGLIYILPSNEADFRMRMFNPDGSEAEMCGNGIRCAAKFAFENNLACANPVNVSTLAGIKNIVLKLDGEKVKAATVDMGKPRLERNEIPMVGDEGMVVSEPLMVGDKNILVTCVSMGNPHCITFVDDVENYPVCEIGQIIENHKSFPNRTNAEFVQVLNRQEIRMRVWERGAGETLACGTGACASAVAAVLNDLVERKITVHLNGGDLEIEWSEPGNVFMTGPAVEVYTGELSSEFLNNL